MKAEKLSMIFMGNHQIFSNSECKQRKQISEKEGGGVLGDVEPNDVGGGRGAAANS